MRTEELIESLARDAKTSRVSMGAWLRGATLPAIAVVAAAFMVLLGPRADIAEAVTTVWFPLKIAIVLIAALLAFPVVEALARPGAPVPAGRLALVVAGLGVAILADLMLLGVAGAEARMTGQNSLECLTIIPLLAAVPLAMTLYALRWGASTQPGATGFAAGIFSGAVGGVLYGLHCADDSPLFVALWYGIAILIVALAGALAGRIVLRW
jgi:hypothetical protein